MGETEVLIDEWGEIFFERARMPDEERARRNLERSLRRARRQMQDYMVANGLDKMWTLTCAEKVYSRSVMVSMVQAFFKKWETYTGRKFPWVWVLEKHKDDSWHCHIAVNDSLWTDKRHLQGLWGHGIVRFDPCKTKRQHGDDRSRMRRLSTYLGKYLTKDFSDDIELGRHRYEVAQGFQPEVTTVHFATFKEACTFIASNELPKAVWCSLDDPDYVGPPCWVFEST